MRIHIKPVLYFSAGICIGVAAVLGFAFKKINPDEKKVEVAKDGRLEYKWYAPELPTAMTFAGEKVPLERQDIRELLDREMIVNYYRQSSTIYILKLSTRYFPAIEERLRANGIPDDFKYLCVAESALQNQTSAAGAIGFWQFMKDTGPHYGLEINEEVDERYNFVKSTDAACQYFKDAYAKFGSWTAAAAAFNCGQGGYTTQATFQQTKNYYNLLLPEETMHYIFRILALKYLIIEARQVGFIIQDKDEYKPYNTTPLTITATIPDLAQFAIDHGTTYKMLKLYNPWLRGHALTIKGGKKYDIQMPTGH